MNRTTETLLGSAGAALAAFVVVYLIGTLLVGLLIVLAALAAGGYAGVAAYRFLSGRPRPPQP